MTVFGVDVFWHEQELFLSTENVPKKRPEGAWTGNMGDRKWMCESLFLSISGFGWRGFHNIHSSMDSEQTAETLCQLKKGPVSTLTEVDTTPERKDVAPKR